MIFSYFMKTNIPLKRIHVSYMECIDKFAILFFALICLENDKFVTFVF